MYGRRVHEAVAAAGDAVSGATVHIVDGEYDHGPVIAQRAACRWRRATTPTTIERKVTAAEPGLLRGRAAADLARASLCCPGCDGTWRGVAAFWGGRAILPTPETAPLISDNLP